MLGACVFHFQLFRLFTIFISKTDRCFTVSWSICFPFSTLGWAETVKGRGPGPYPWTTLAGPPFLVF